MRIMFGSFQSSKPHSNRAYGIATAYGLDVRGIVVRVSVGQEFSLLHLVQISSGANPVSYPVSTGGFLTRGKAAGA
jgi:hypothetical protein